MAIEPAGALDFSNNVIFEGLRPFVSLNDGRSCTGCPVNDNFRCDWSTLSLRSEV